MIASILHKMDPELRSSLFRIPVQEQMQVYRHIAEVFHFQDNGPVNESENK